MARLNVHVPDELAERARASGLNISALTQSAIRTELENRHLDTWLDDLPLRAISHEAALSALDEARAETESARG